jgi:hypothetical protein
MTWKTRNFSSCCEGAPEPDDLDLQPAETATVRSLADESFQVVVLEDCCAAGTDELHEKDGDHQHDLLPCDAGG